MKLRPLAVLLSAAALALGSALPGVPVHAASSGDGPIAVTKDVRVWESSRLAVLHSKLEKPATRDIKITWAVEAGTATADDYGETTGTATIRKGSRSAKIVIPIVDDYFAENYETFSVLLFSKRARMKPGVVDVTIRDDEIGPEFISGTIHGHTNDSYSATHISWQGNITLTYEPLDSLGQPIYWPTWQVSDGTVSWTATGKCSGSGTLSGQQLYGDLVLYPGQYDPAYGTLYDMLVTPGNVTMTVACPDGPDDISYDLGKGGDGGFLVYAAPGPLWAPTDYHTLDLRSYTGNFYPAEFTCGADWQLTGTGNIVLPSRAQ